MGPSVKFVSTNKGLISKKKWGVNFFLEKLPYWRAKDHTFSQYVFLNPSLSYKQLKKRGKIKESTKPWQKQIATPIKLRKLE